MVYFVLDKKFIIISIINLFLAYKLYYYLKPPIKEIITIPIVMKIRNEYFYQSIITITSLIENSNKETKYDIFILVPNNFMINNRLKLLTLEVKYKNIKINLVESEDPFVKIKNYKSNYYKLYLPHLIPGYDKIIFLNWNTIVSEDLEQLYNLGVGDYYFLGFLNNDNSTYTFIENSLNITIEKKIKTNVLLINMKKLKENNFIKEFKSLYIKYKDNKEMNEEIMINILYRNKIGILPPKYGMPNFNNSDIALEYNKNITQLYRYDNKEYIPAYFKPAIIDFICKPWELGKKCQNNEAFWYYAKKSAYFEEIKEIFGKFM